MNVGSWQHPDKVSDGRPWPSLPENCPVWAVCWLFLNPRRFSLCWNALGTVAAQGEGAGGRARRCDDVTRWGSVMWACCSCTASRLCHVEMPRSEKFSCQRRSLLPVLGRLSILCYMHPFTLDSAEKKMERDTEASTVYNGWTIKK
jgi:hypothetical protein